VSQEALVLTSATPTFTPTRLSHHSSADLHLRPTAVCSSHPPDNTRLLLYQGPNRRRRMTMSLILSISTLALDSTSLLWHIFPDTRSLQSLSSVRQCTTIFASTHQKQKRSRSILRQKKTFLFFQNLLILREQHPLLTPQWTLHHSRHRLL